MSEKKLFLLDGMALIYRSFFAFSNNHRYNSKGLNTSAMFGFTLTLLDVLQKEKPSHIAVVFDTDKPTERHEIFPEYKAQRESMPEDLSKSIPYIFKIIEAFNIPVITLDGFEADDIIGTLAWEASEKGFETYMMTPDKDFAQLVRPNVFIYKPARQGNGAEVLDVAKVLEKWEVKNPLQVIDILALWGDAVDNIPGIPGIGEKTAKKLIAIYDSVENLIANAADLKGAQKEKVIAFAEQGLLSKKLATIITNVPVSFDEKSLVLDPPNKELIEDVFKELEFRTLLQKVFNQSAPAVAHQQSAQGDLFAPSSASGSYNGPVDEVELPVVFASYDPEIQSYKLIDKENITELNKLVDALLASPEFCFDTETTSIDAHDAEIIGIALSSKKNEGYYVNLLHEDKALFLSILKPLFSCKAVKIAQNLKYDLLVLQHAGIELTPPFYDTMLAHYLLEPDKRHKMDELARNFLKYDPIAIETLIGKKGKDQLNMATIEPKKVAIYAAEDADITLQLYHVFKPLIKEQSLEKVLFDIELPLVPVLAQMERNGVKLDIGFLSQYSHELAAFISELEKDIISLAGVKFNIASPKQLGEVLFDKLKLMDKPKKTKTGQYQTNEEVLQKLANTHEIVGKILDYRELQKLKSTYVDALPLLVSKKTGRVHTSFNQAIAATGRLSSNNPNLQNIPIRTEKGRHIRKAFVASSDSHVLVSADYSQIELRVIASVSKDKSMMEAFIQNLDIHTSTAAKVFDVHYDEVTKEMRSKAKMVNFGIIYGISAFGLSERLGIPRKEAKEIIDEYFVKFPGIKSYMDNTIAEAKQNGYVKTLLGRRRYVPDITSANQTVRGFAERNAINAPIQGAAADMIKLAMIKVQNKLKELNLKTILTLQVHDELLLDVPLDELEIVATLVKEEMQDAMELDVPVVVEAGFGKNWLQAH
jgi:DNA polymerase I